jgi:hypothetical protein
MTNEHFLKGSGEGREEPLVKVVAVKRVTAKPVSKRAVKQRPLPVDEFLGAKVTSGMGRNNDDDVYGAEQSWMGLGVIPGVKKGGIANRDLSLSEARNLSRTIINHPAMDSIPGIDAIRKHFNPKQISFHKQLNKAMVGDGVTTRGMHYQEFSAGNNGLNQLQFSSGYKPRHPRGRVKLGVVTHEVAHYILNNSEAPGPDDHHWPMARLHLHIIKNVLNHKESHHILKSMYDYFKVNYGDKAS